MIIRHSASARDAKLYDTTRLREEFLVEVLFEKDNIHRYYSHIDRIITMGYCPSRNELSLEDNIDIFKNLGTTFFLERRELGVINIGGKGYIIVDGEKYPMNHKDGLYVGMGTKTVIFGSENPEEPAKFYSLSAPAHKEYPLTHIDITKAQKRPIGDQEFGNKRTIYQYIHPDVMESCQLSMGLTTLEHGNMWNTMPCHTHERRMEVYFYFDMDEDNVVFHLFGEPTETRHIVVRNEQAVVSPSWSIHSGCGTKAYSFIWGMVGENKTFDDMDHVDMKLIK